MNPHYVRSALALGALALFMITGCSSSDDSSGSGGHGGSAQASSAGSGGASTGNAGASSSAGSGGSTSTGGAMSAACQMYCECHEKNCASQAIPGGATCGDFCAAMTADQLACRQNMCGLVPAQPDNDHCKHSVGIDQCL